MWEAGGASRVVLSLPPKRGVGKKMQNQRLSRLGYVGKEASYPHARAPACIMWRGCSGP